MPTTPKTMDAVQAPIAGGLARIASVIAAISVRTSNDLMLN